MCKLISLHCVKYIYLSMIEIINTCIMYRFNTYYKYSIIIFDLFILITFTKVI